MFCAFGCNCPYTLLSTAQEKFRHFHGQTSVSPNHNKPAYAYRFIILSALLFTGPTARLNSLRTICSDKIMNHTVYGNLVRELRSEWNLYMTFVSMFEVLTDSCT